MKRLSSFMQSVNQLKETLDTCHSIQVSFCFLHSFAQFRRSDDVQGGGGGYKVADHLTHRTLRNPRTSPQMPLALSGVQGCSLLCLYQQAVTCTSENPTVFWSDSQTESVMHIIVFFFFFRNAFFQICSIKKLNNLHNDLLFCKEM